MRHAQYIRSGERYDVCIVGAGPAGITIALQLARFKKKILLIEGGGLAYSSASQANYNGETVGDKYFSLKSTRLRFFGGSSNHWGGWCRELDEADFNCKGSFSQTSWPIDKSDLQPYVFEANQILDVASVPDDINLSGHDLHRAYFNYSPPVRFLDKYYGQVKENPRISLRLNCDFLGFYCDDEQVTHIRVRDHQAEAREFQADTFVLATGGIENSRLLLWSDLLNKGRLLKGNRTIGRYWMEHPHFTVGKALLTRDFPFRCDRKRRMFFAPTEDAMARYNILNCSIRVREPTTHGAKKMMRKLGKNAPRFHYWTQPEAEASLYTTSDVRASWEQEPRYENRVELSDSVDELGIPRPRLVWKKSELDLRTVRLSSEIFGQYLARSNLGRLWLEDWVLGNADYPKDDELAGNHHMGGTRMADSPKDGVVDRNSRVFGQKNLYVAGSSVFPSGGYANPTFTIVQLALRLADYLGKIWTVG